MASLSQIYVPLGIRTSSNIKSTTNNKLPCIARLCNNNRHLNNLVSKPKLLPLTKQCQNEKWKVRGSDDVAPEFLPAGPSPMHIVHDFYEAFNQKDTEKLKQFLLPNCVYQDLLFYNAYEGQESVINFWLSMMDAMGPNIHIFVEDVEENNHLMATVLWHLEWKNKKIPFTNGCRFFTFEEVEGKLFISKITGLEEFPVKPGELVLKLLKGIRTLLDSYPLAAGAMLDSHASQSQDGGTHGGTGMHFDVDLFGRKH